MYKHFFKRLLDYPVRRNCGEYDEATVAIGKNNIRKQIVESIKVGKYLSAVHPTAIVSPRAKMGCGTVVMQGAIIQSCA